MCLSSQFMATSFPFILLEFMGFLPFLPKAIPTIFWFFAGISLGLPTKLLVVRPLPVLRVCLPHHSPFPNKIHCFVSLPFTALPPPKLIRVEGFLHLLLWHASSSLAIWAYWVCYILPWAFSAHLFYLYLLFLTRAY